MSDEPESEVTPPARRFRFPRPRFTLRVFLLVVTGVAVWLGLHIRATDQQRNAVRTLRDFGGWVRYDFQFKDEDFDPKAESWVPDEILERFGVDFFHPVEEVNLVYTEDLGGRMNNDNTQAAPLECLSGLPKLTRLYMHEGQANDKNMAHIAALSRLERFYVWDARHVSDEGVEHLKSLKELTHIHLSDSRITDKSLRLLSRLPNLEKLTLQFNRFTDEGVRELATLRKLKSLWVCGKAGQPNPITNESLEFLFELPDLERLGVQRTKVTSSFERRLRKKFPKCRIARR